MANNKIRIATRKSPLALWQAEHVANRLKSLWPQLQTELIPMLTSGDNYLKDRLQTIGGKGLFMKELEIALVEDRADIAVHSMKDVPAVLPDGLKIDVICKRENPFDALVSQKYANLADFPDGSIIGTSSLRRQSQIQAFRPKLQIKTLRGNIHTRISKLENEDYDGIILAASGLIRMGFNSKISQEINSDIMLPACGQGALGIESRVGDSKLLDLIKPLNDTNSSLCIRTERYVNKILGGGCHSPIGIFCQITENNELFLQTKVLSPNGEQEIYAFETGTFNESQEIANKCVETLLQKGAKKLLSIE
ncbi:MAG: hydroxymethylbilane synthase [Legionellaceae bacterium]|nr:hydroxymethylbilane synthase [Legionellaceae bacterium]